ncbi:hypothetical protein PR001_g22800 [Phytophthora rubi]|uniref:Uncharacterized protein n=1 Tax=Phytophthora rubi TaxID=129364 RepID=A0A6A3IS22_9STRA|nr:hypothetical protein PR001_g22800 [Phytophthora rubi]
MVQEGTRAATDLLLTARALYAVLVDSSEEEESLGGSDSRSTSVRRGERGLVLLCQTVTTVD